MALSTALISFQQNAHAQCAYEITAVDSSFCPGDSTTLNVMGSDNTLTTTLAAGNNHRGNMFSIVALNTVLITSFDAHPMGDTDIEVYYRSGSYIGFESSSVGWTLVGSASVIAQPQGTATPIPLAIDVTIPAGQTYSFYVTSSNVAVSLNYSNGTTEGNILSQDANIQFLEGKGMEYPFAAGGGTFSPRVWNGNIHYSIPLTVDWSTGSQGSSISVSPTTSTYYSATITDTLNGCSNIDSIYINVLTPPTVNLLADSILCPGDSLILDAGNPGSMYLWSTTDSTQAITVNTAGTYDVFVTDTLGCTGSDSIVITAGVATVAAFSSSPNLLSADFVDNSTNATSWAWDFGDGNTSTLQNPSHLYAANGTYTVTLIATGPCGPDTTSASVTVFSDVSIKELILSQSLELFPNPNNGEFTLTIDGVSGEEMNIVVTDIRGAVLYSSTSIVKNTIIDLTSELTDGIYIVQVTVDGTRVSKRIAVRK